MKIEWADEAIQGLVRFTVTDDKDFVKLKKQVERRIRIWHILHGRLFRYHAIVDEAGK